MKFRTLLTEKNLGFVMETFFNGTFKRNEKKRIKSFKICVGEAPPLVVTEIILFYRTQHVFISFFFIVNKH